MAKTIDETLLPRPPQLLDVPALAPATRRAAERLQEQFNLSPEAAEAFAAAVVDPAEIRKTADNPEAAVRPGRDALRPADSGVDPPGHARPPKPAGRARPAAPRRRRARIHRGGALPAHPRTGPRARRPAGAGLAIESREHLTWASVIAKKYILKDNDWRLSIRNQGVMTEVWLSAVTLVHGDGTAAVTVPVTSEGSSRLVACHDILDIRSADVPYSRDDRALRSIVRSLNEAVTNGPTAEQAEALRCETVPALLLVGFEPHPGSTATFATAVRSLVALRHVEPPKPWNEAAKMGSIADAVLEALTDQGLLRPEEELWLLGALTPEEAEAKGFSADPAVRAARIVRLLTDTDPTVHQTIRVAITGQTTKQRITNKFKLEVAAALILRAVSGAEEGQKVSDIYRALQTGFADVLASEPWQATYRATDDVVAEALREVGRGAGTGPASLELAARAAFPLVVSRQLFPDRGTKNNDQVDRRQPGTSSTGCGPTSGASASSARLSPITPPGGRSALYHRRANLSRSTTATASRSSPTTGSARPSPPPAVPSHRPPPTPPMSATSTPWPSSARRWTPLTAPSAGCSPSRVSTVGPHPDRRRRPGRRRRLAGGPNEADAAHPGVAQHPRVALRRQPPGGNGLGRARRRQCRPRSRMPTTQAGSWDYEEETR